MIQIKRALISVADKQGVPDFARALQAMGISILSTGGTARMLAESGVTSEEVSAYTGFPEIMDGRVKTLHPKIHGGLLGRRGVDDEVMRANDIAPIDLLVVNLYPFENTIARPDCSLDQAIENIDIGGPAMLRAAAKNFEAVTVVADPGDYEPVLADLAGNGGAVSHELRLALAAKAYAHCAHYDGAISSYLSRHQRGQSPGRFADPFVLNLRKARELRYGENPHQSAALYLEAVQTEASIAFGTQVQGRTLSFNNIADADAALECVKQFYEPACVIVKHGNPCGVALDDDILQAYRRAYSTDPTSAFGGIIALNQPLDAQTVREILHKQFVEVIVAPDLTRDSRELLERKPDVRVLTTGAWLAEPAAGLDFKRVIGGLLVQERDTGLLRKEDLNVVTARSPTEHELKDLLFAWKVAKYVKSNAIVYAKDLMTIGIGAGQMSRVYSARIGAMKAVDYGLAVKGCVMASDAFFPFRDAIDGAAESGVTAVIQPGGSKRDPEVIAAADEHGLAMVVTGMRHFRH